MVCREMKQRHGARWPSHRRFRRAILSLRCLLDIVVGCRGYSFLWLSWMPALSSSELSESREEAHIPYELVLGFSLWLPELVRTNTVSLIASMPSTVEPTTEPGIANRHGAREDPGVGKILTREDSVQ